MFSAVGSVYAANGEKVSVKIKSNQSSATSTKSIWNCQGYLELEGKNKSTSKNSLYVQCYEQIN